MTSVVYLDTSALVKLFVVEPHSEAVVSACQRAHGVATSPVAYAEARAALARRAAEGALPSSALRRVVAALDRVFWSLILVSVSNDLARTAGDVAERHGLRGFDAIHLASALALRKAVGPTVFLSCYDDRMCQAAVAEGLALSEQDGEQDPE